MGESIQLRPSNQSGVVAYLGATQFAPGLWVGVELDTVRTPFSFRAWCVGSSYPLLGSHCCYSVSYMTTIFSLFSKFAHLFFLQVQGKHDGTVQGVRYFSCPPKKGIFVRPKNLKVGTVYVDSDHSSGFPSQPIAACFFLYIRVEKTFAPRWTKGGGRCGQDGARAAAAGTRRTMC